MDTGGFEHVNGGRVVDVLEEAHDGLVGTEVELSLGADAAATAALAFFRHASEHFLEIWHVWLVECLVCVWLRVKVNQTNIIYYFLRRNVNDTS